MESSSVEVFIARLVCRALVVALFFDNDGSYSSSSSSFDFFRVLSFRERDREKLISSSLDSSIIDVVARPCRPATFTFSAVDLFAIGVFLELALGLAGVTFEAALRGAGVTVR